MATESYVDNLRGRATAARNTPMTVATVGNSLGVKEVTTPAYVLLRPDEADAIADVLDEAERLAGVLANEADWRSLDLEDALERLARHRR